MHGFPAGSSAGGGGVSVDVIEVVSWANVAIGAALIITVLVAHGWVGRWG